MKATRKAYKGNVQGVKCNRKFCCPLVFFITRDLVCLKNGAKLAEDIIPIEKDQSWGIDGFQICLRSNVVSDETIEEQFDSRSAPLRSLTRVASSDASSAVAIELRGVTLCIFFP